jgi:hypothetical protein
MLHKAETFNHVPHETEFVFTIAYGFRCTRPREAHVIAMRQADELADSIEFHLKQADDLLK